MKEKIEIVKRMVECGYHLFDESIEQFAARNTLENLKYFEECFREWKRDR